MGSYHIELVKEFDPHNNVCHITIVPSEDMLELLTAAVVRNLETKKHTVFGKEHERYRAKRMLVDEDVLSRGAMLLFSKKLIDEGQYRFRLDTLNSVEEIIGDLSAVDQIVERIKEAVEVERLIFGYSD